MQRRWTIGLGANIGDARGALERTLGRLRDHPELHVVAVSSLWHTAPIDADGPDYLNAVVAIESALDPSAMLAIAQALESQEGRTRPHRNAPRTLDVDLLLAGSLIVASPTLTLPHPRMHERAFVLAPLIEIQPDAQIPGLGPASSLLAQCAAQRLDRIGPLTAPRNGRAPTACAEVSR